MRLKHSETITKLIRKYNYCNEFSKATFLRASLKAPKGSDDYALDEAGLDTLIDLYKKGKWYFVAGVSGAKGVEILGGTSGARAIVGYVAKDLNMLTIYIRY